MACFCSTLHVVWPRPCISAYLLVLNQFCPPLEYNVIQGFFTVDSCISLLSIKFLSFISKKKKNDNKETREK